MRPRRGRCWPWSEADVLILLKLVGAPGSLTFLAVCLILGVGVMYVWPRNRRMGRRWLVGVVSCYLFLGLPCVANAIAGALPKVDTAQPASLRPLDTLLVLDGDNRRGRVREAVEVFKAASPRGVLVLGDAWLLDPLLQGGIPWALIKHDSEGPNTLEQVARVRTLVSAGLAGRTAVIASRLQVPRVAALLRAQDLQVPLVSSPIDTEPPTSGVGRFVPSYFALRVSRDAIYEHAALAYYRWKGWTK